MWLVCGDTLTKMTEMETCLVQFIKDSWLDYLILHRLHWNKPSVFGFLFGNIIRAKTTWGQIITALTSIVFRRQGQTFKFKYLTEPAWQRLLWLNSIDPHKIILENLVSTFLWLLLDGWKVLNLSWEVHPDDGKVSCTSLCDGSSQLCGSKWTLCSQKVLKLFSANTHCPQKGVTHCS